MTNTPSSLDFARYQIVPSYSHVTFRVRACRDAHIALMPSVLINNNASTYYEVVIGSDFNTQIEIIKRPVNDRVTADTPSILSCSDFR